MISKLSAVNVTCGFIVCLTTACDDGQLVGDPTYAVSGPVNHATDVQNDRASTTTGDASVTDTDSSVIGNSSTDDYDSSLGHFPEDSSTDSMVDANGTVTEDGSANEADGSTGDPLIQSVSGDMTYGNVVYIEGSNFGSGPNVVVYDDFENGTAGEAISLTQASYGEWRDTVGDVTYGDSHRFSGNLAMRADHNGGINNGVHAAMSGTGADAKKFFIFYRVLFPRDSVWPGSLKTWPNCINWKMIWVVGPGGSTKDSDAIIASISGGAPTSESGVPCNDIFNGFMFGANDAYQGGYESVVDWYDYPPVFIHQGEWDTNWTWVEGSKDFDGLHKMWSIRGDGEHGVELIRDSENIKIFNDDSSGYWSAIWFNGFQRQSENSESYWDDLYVATGDNAAARVMVANNVNLNESTKIAVATPRSWVNNKIDAELNLANFDSSDSLYLFVFDSKNHVSSGYQIDVPRTLN